MRSARSPIIDYVLSVSRGTKCTEQDQSHIRAAFYLEGYISGRIGFLEASNGLIHSIGSNHTLILLQEILATPAVSSVEQEVKDGKRARTKMWTVQEDRRLLFGIHKYGTSNWAEVAKCVGNGRSRSQCSQRWMRGLDPSIDRSGWTPEQDKKLIMLVKELGEKSWTKIGRQMGNRCDVQCRYRYKQLKRDIERNKISLDSISTSVIETSPTVTSSPYVPHRRIMITQNARKQWVITSPSNSCLNTDGDASKLAS